jgi:hypothetical protein
MPSHPLRAGNGTVLLHRALLYELIGPGPHPCHWCGRVLRWKAPFIPIPPRPPLIVRTDARGRHYADLPAMADALRQQGGELTVDHRNGCKGDNRAWNLVPACRACNGERGDAGNPAFFKLRTRDRWLREVAALFAQVVGTVRGIVTTSIRVRTHPKTDSKSRRGGSRQQIAARRAPLQQQDRSPPAPRGRADMPEIAMQRAPPRRSRIQTDPGNAVRRTAPLLRSPALRAFPPP